MIMSTKEQGDKYMININMRCIEISPQDNMYTKAQTININMRCIEIKEMGRLTPLFLMININMRCIEIWYFQHYYQKHH